MHWRLSEPTMDALPYRYGWEKLTEAMHFLIGPKPQKEWLTHAVAALSLIRSEENLPLAMRAEFSEFIKENETQGHG